MIFPGQISGDNIAYIYPDGVTAFKGTFENKFMKKAWNVDVEEYECDPNGMFMPKKFSSPLSDREFYYEPCTNESFGGIYLNFRAKNAPSLMSNFDFYVDYFWHEKWLKIINCYLTVNHKRCCQTLKFKNRQKLQKSAKL